MNAVRCDHCGRYAETVEAIDTYRREYLALDGPSTRRKKIEKLVVWPQSPPEILT